MRWISTTTPPDGSRTSFQFSAEPVYIVWNGINQISGAGYVVDATSPYTVHFVDALGATLTPASGDVIRGYRA